MAGPGQDDVLDALGDVIDPEVGVDVVALGLVYAVRVEGSAVSVDLTMTTAACPLGEQIVDDARNAIAAIPWVSSVEVNLVWDPPWGPERMSEATRRHFGWD